MSEKNLYETESQRQLKIGRYVRVSQSVSLREFIWKEAQVSWSAIGSVNWREANDFANDLAEAIAIAKRWTAERAGKSE